MTTMVATVITITANLILEVGPRARERARVAQVVVVVVACLMMRRRRGATSGAAARRTREWDCPVPVRRAASPRIVEALHLTRAQLAVLLTEEATEMMTLKLILVLPQILLPMGTSSATMSA